MTDFEKEIVSRNENWVLCSHKEIIDLENKIKKERNCIRDLIKQNRELKGRA